MKNTILKSLLISLDRVALEFSKLLASISSIAIIIWPIIMLFYVIFRNLGYTWLFVEEFTEYWLVGIVYFSLAYTLRVKGHINVDILTNYLSNRSKKILEIITDILSLFVVVFLTTISFDWVKYGFLYNARSSYPSRLILWPFYLFVPIGLISLFFELLNNILKNVLPDMYNKAHHY